jgi:hypothetical protein
MARKALIQTGLLLLLCGVAGCQTVEQRVAEVARADGQTRAQLSLPDLPPECTAKVGRVKPGDEPWVVSIRRWEVLAENRDEKSLDCAAWWADYRARMAEKMHGN